jgi:3-methyladenine DNA glycosylase AlkD
MDQIKLRKNIAITNLKTYSAFFETARIFKVSEKFVEESVNWYLSEYGHDYKPEDNNKLPTEEKLRKFLKEKEGWQC